MANIAALKAEIDADPLTRGYAGMTDAQVAADINTAYRQINRESMSSSEVMNAINIGEFNALSTADRQNIWNVLHLGGSGLAGGGNINPFGVEATIFTNAFGGGSATITALAAARKETVTRAQELSLGRVGEGTVAEARAL